MTPLNQLLKIGKSMRILYVEDDEALQQELTLLLSDIFETITLASNGEEGLEAYKKNSYDLVITDIRMPILDGVGMIEKIRHINPIQSIIVTSAHNEAEYLIKLIHLGVDSFITKPLSSDEIFETLYKSVRHIYEAKELCRQKSELEDFKQNIETQVTQKSFQLKSDFLKIKSYKEAYERISSTMVVDIQGKIIECSSPVAEMLHFELKELLGRSLEELLHVKVDFVDFIQTLNDLSETSLWRNEMIFIDSLANTHNCVVITTPICLKDECAKFMLYVQDVTRWNNTIKEKEFALECSRENYSLAKSIENIPIPAVVLGDDGSIIYANTEVVEMIEDGFDSGVMRKMLNGSLRLWDLVEFDDEDLCSTSLWDNKSPTHCEAKYKTILGVINIHIKIKKLSHESGAYLALFCYQGVGDDAL